MSSMQSLNVGRPFLRPRVKAESEKLLADWGADAPDMARILAFRAEAGLLHESAPGFWKSVAHAIGHSIGLPDAAARGDNLLAV